MELHENSITFGFQNLINTRIFYKKPSKGLSSKVSYKQFRIKTCLNREKPDSNIIFSSAL